MRLTNVWPYRRIVSSRHFLAALWRARRNIVATNCKNQPATGPYLAELDTTYQCNCRCQMCRRWKQSRSGELTVNEYQKLAETFDELGVHQVSIAGGEPLLREDIFSIIEIFARHGMCVNVCTNGTLLESHVDQVLHSGAACVTVSLDGVTAHSHESIRGAPGSYALIEKGIRFLVASPRAKRPIVRLRMTISNQNVHEIRAYYETWKPIVDDVLFQPAHNCQHSHYTGLDEETLHIDPAALSEQIDGTALTGDQYMERLIASLRENGGFPRQRCFAGVLMVRIDPWGNVFPCLEQHVRVGSIREQDFKTIWESEEFARERNRLGREKECTCWYNNTALIGHYGNLLSRLGRRAVWRAVEDLCRASWNESLGRCLEECTDKPGRKSTSDAEAKAKAQPLP